jgi:maltose/moltooligosaccharide transporter
MTTMERLPASKMISFSVASAGSGMFNAFFNSAVPLFLARYPLPFWLVGLLAQERSFLGGFLEPLVGAASDRTRTRLGRRRPYFLVGVPLAALFLVAMAYEPPVRVLVPILLFLPFFLAISDRPYRAMMADISEPAQRGRLGGTMAVLEMVGQVGLLLLISQIWATHETEVFYIIALGMVLGYGFTFLAVREPAPPPAPGPLAIASPLSYLRRVFQYREAAKWVSAHFLSWLGIGGVTPFLTRYAVFELGMEESEAFLLFLLLVGFTALTALPAGFLGDRFGKKPVLLAGLTLFSVSVLAGSQAHTTQQIMVALAFAGVANGVNTALGFAFLTELLPRQRMGELTGLGAMVWSVAQPLGAAFAGLLADQTGTLRSTLVLAGLLLAGCVLILLTIKPTRVDAESGPGSESGTSN